MIRKKTAIMEIVILEISSAHNQCLHLLISLLVDKYTDRNTLIQEVYRSISSSEYACHQILSQNKLTEWLNSLLHITICTEIRRRTKTLIEEIGVCLIAKM